MCWWVWVHQKCLFSSSTFFSPKSISHIIIVFMTAVPFLHTAMYTLSVNIPPLCRKEKKKSMCGSFARIFFPNFTSGISLPICILYRVISVWSYWRHYRCPTQYGWGSIILWSAPG